MKALSNDFQWNGADWDYQTIGDEAALGICGSGLIDLLAELRRHDLMSPKGVFSERKKELVIDADSGITFSRLDASNLAQAKAANYCGQYIVLRALGLSPSRRQQTLSGRWICPLRRRSGRHRYWIFRLRSHQSA